MEQVFQILDTAWHVLLAGLFAMTPGALVWLTILGAFLLIRQLMHRGHDTTAA